MAEFICRLGTLRAKWSRAPSKRPACMKRARDLSARGSGSLPSRRPRQAGPRPLTSGGRGGANSRIKASDFLLFNQQLAALFRAGPDPAGDHDAQKACGFVAAARCARRSSNRQFAAAAALSLHLPRRSDFPAHLYGFYLSRRAQRRPRRCPQSLCHLHAAKRAAACSRFAARSLPTFLLIAISAWSRFLTSMSCLACPICFRV